ncbi:MAG: glycosyltransferase family 4 protein [Polyangiaceae bacterium]|nr:glycosyltransferase family 4 protein [Polyangiaceae bacterium]
MLGNHVPRLCGIATFTRDLREALVRECPELDCFVVAMNDGENRYDYPPEVRWQLEDGNLGDYRRAAEFLNDSAIDVLSVQHEFGIYGGPAGRYLTTLLEAVRAPILTTLHTILTSPDDTQRAAMDDLVRLSARIVTMSEHGASLLRGLYGASASLIDVVPHGIPDVPIDSTAKGQIGLTGRRIILTFGLLSPDKGIEDMIGALPAIATRFPNVIYLIVGATHPHILARDGNRYRDGLALHAERLGVSEYVRFVDRFVSQEELVGTLSAADIYVTPYLNPEQITSGTLAYAVGAGKAVISTPYRYARELLAEGLGVLVPWRSASGIANAVIELFGDRGRYDAMCARAADRGRSMRWPRVARGYWRSLEWATTPRPVHVRAAPRPAADRDLPELNLSHLRVLTDRVGLLQHAILTVPRYDEGYTLDDNARALLLTTTLLRRHSVDDEPRLRLESTYLAFVQRSFDGRSGRFRNFMSYGREWLETIGSEDSHGRALWALGSLIEATDSPERRVAADYLFRAALRAVPRFTSPRAGAFAVLGIAAALTRYPGDAGLVSALPATSEHLLEAFARSTDPAWPWCEEQVTYANATLPHALIVAGARLRDDRMTTTGLRALSWLMEIQRSPSGDFSPVGSNGFFRRDGVMATYDQQPIEAGATVAACLQAHEVTGEDAWMARARRAFGWFLGQNVLGQALFDASTGGCRDGLHEDRLNQNEGAESTLAFLQALSDLRNAEQAERVDRHPERHARAESAACSVGDQASAE